LVVTPTSLNVEVEGGHRVVTTLATVRDPLAVCFDRIVVEGQYFDANKAHVDTVTQMLEFPVLAGREVAFRVRDEAARDKSAYVSQSVRIVSADPRRVVASKEEPGVLLGLILSWAPMLLLIGVWGLFVRRTNRASSPNGRIASAAEAQTLALNAQTAALERVVAALETR
jgi:hypothetical protein